MDSCVEEINESEESMLQSYPCMKKCDRRELPLFFEGQIHSHSGRLMKAGAFSLLFHVVLFVFLSLNLKPTLSKVGPSFYQVTIRPLSTPAQFSPDPIEGLPTHLLVPEKTQFQKEQNKSKQEIKFDKKDLDHEITPSAQPVPLEEQKQFSQHQEEEERVKEPIPLPIAAVSPSDSDSNLNNQDNPPIPSTLFQLAEKHMSAIRGNGVGDGSRTGLGGPSGEGSGKEQGMGGGGLHWGGSGKESRIGQGGHGAGGSGSGSGSGRGGSGGGGSGNGGAALPHPRYANNPSPVYPPEARAQGYEGEVLLRVEVLGNGRVGQIEVKKSSGHKVLDQSALMTVKQWKFIPAKKGDIAIPFWVNVPIKFQLL